jgi:MFS family permease
MLAMFFFLALYLQNIKGYSPLQAGVRFLPSTALIIVIGPIAGRLTDRIGPRFLMTGGLLAVAGSLFWQSFLQVNTSYGFLIGAFALMGVGMGFVMSPMSTAAMNAVDATKAGVASGVLSMSRMVGGTFGVAVLGALITALGRSRLDTLLPHSSAVVRTRLADALGTGGGRQGHLPGRLLAASHDAFVYAMTSGVRIGAGVAVLGAALAWLLIVRDPAPGRVAVGDPTASSQITRVERAAADAAPEPVSI